MDLAYTFAMDDDFKDGDFFSALYTALDRLEALDPESLNEPWFKMLE